ncbi:MAG: hypothetical protein GF355_08670 [Candidatus Eisenbacteria bacterium]|nr:hypothetical protein [Candidatus Eisenbacteria bacterium]
MNAGSRNSASPESLEDAAKLAAFLERLEREGRERSRAQLAELLENPPPVGSSPACLKTAQELVQSLRANLPEIPDSSLGADWAYLCRTFREDLLTSPEQVLHKLRDMLERILKADNARMFLVSNSADRAEIRDELESFAGRLDASEASARRTYSGEPAILQRLRERRPDAGEPVYAGLVHPSTRNGVLVFSARTTSPWDADRDAVLDNLTGRLYGGGGGHGLFMRTWAAGLAYSNGYGYGEGTGRVGYYAERCPDVAETMRFVVGILEKAELDERLVEYAVAGAFNRSRAADRYESRGEAMAEDLADGVTPERVRRFREAVLAVRHMDGLGAALHERMPRVYGQVLIGYGPPLAESRDGVFFLIGPEEQFASAASSSRVGWKRMASRRRSRTALRRLS